MANSEPTILYWDFFGPRAEKTAIHFQKHLLEFLEKAKITSATTGTVSEGEGHTAVFCRAEPPDVEILVTSLRPQRMQPSTEEL